MSGFDENPFGEPNLGDPFKVHGEISHFSAYFSKILIVYSYLIAADDSQDPSIQQVARNTANNTQNLDDYDPFGSPTSNQPPTLQTSNQTTTTLPAYSASGQQYQVNEPNGAGTGVTQISTAELQVSHQYFFFLLLCQ